MVVWTGRAALIELRPASIDDMLALRQHFRSIAEVQRWGGEGFQLPLTNTRFMAQLQTADTESFILQQRKKTIGFGQLCDRFGKHHLARLLVLPDVRGQGYGKHLIMALLRHGHKINPRLDFSLFVYTSNQVALSLYQQLGFVECVQPQPHRDDLYFMTLSAESAKALLANWNGLVER